jgi:hypothetical protein
MEKFTSEKAQEPIDPIAGTNFELDALKMLADIARSTGKTIEEVIENNRLTNPGS